MSGGAGKRAKRGEKAQAAEDDSWKQELLEIVCSQQQNLLPQRLPNVASSGQSVVGPPLAQVGEKRSLEPGMSASESKLQKSAKSAEARAALRAVERAVLCANSTSWLVLDSEKQQKQSTLSGFKRQLDEMHKDETVKAGEYDDVIKDMKLLETHYKKEAFGK